MIIPYLDPWLFPYLDPWLFSYLGSKSTLTGLSARWMRRERRRYWISNWSSGSLKTGLDRYCSTRSLSEEKAKKLIKKQSTHIQGSRYTLSYDVDPDISFHMMWIQIYTFIWCGSRYNLSYDADPDISVHTMWIQIYPFIWCGSTDPDANLTNNM